MKLTGHASPVCLPFLWRQLRRRVRERARGRLCLLSVVPLPRPLPPGGAVQCLQIYAQQRPAGRCRLACRACGGAGGASLRVVPHRWLPPCRTCSIRWLEGVAFDAPAETAALWLSNASAQYAAAVCRSAKLTAKLTKVGCENLQKATRDAERTNRSNEYVRRRLLRGLRSLRGSGAAIAL